MSREAIHPPDAPAAPLLVDAAGAAQNPEAAQEPPRLALRPKEAAASLGIGVRLLWELTNRGEIPSLKLGRCTVYPVHVLQKWLRDRATP